MTPTTTSSKRPGLLALGSAVVIAVYAAGYLRTRSAAAAYAIESPDDRPAQVSPDVFQPRTPTERLDSMAVAAITEAVNASKRPASTVARRLKGKAATNRVATTKRRAPAAVVAATPSPAPRQAPVVPEPVSAQSAAEPAPPPPPLRAEFKDGVYRGYGTSRHGDIEAEVEVTGGRIASARISQCLTRYSCSWISELPGEVVDRQSAKVDYVSGATQSSSAFIQAVTEALSKAR